MKPSPVPPHLSHVETHLPPQEGDLTRLAALLRLYTPYDGLFDLRLPGVHASRSTRINEDLVHSIQQPALCIVAQGAKSVFLGSDVYEYDPSRLLVYSVDLSVATRVTRASRHEPFFNLKIDLNPRRIAELALQAFPYGLPKVHENRGVSVSTVSAGIVSAAVRLMEAMADEREAQLLGPILVDEILMRLLLGPIGGRVAQLGQAESSVERVAQAIEWVRTHYDEPLSVDALAEMVHMSASTFHLHFKAVTSLSPIQYQKMLRLQEARRLLASTSLDAGAASRRVGYASASQFTREYARLFGRTPLKDLTRLREQGNLPATVS
ncbi:AraC family transcriptional regulator (plasmid) [Deinococcus sp. KNUC1210]|uniref:AraC family transcriptional regulator n=1 Tax=Deinococcus sp. KNUC1210 TaxID=2917691 RepID=UPI001EEFEE3D|nr:AraC family transcriptional regulator [Deinococcus sp. KNUC1210]ULH17941.1 AraC family transcriptional regulator [Deinococcus sp. KNUC1210]